MLQLREFGNFTGVNIVKLSKSEVGYYVVFLIYYNRHAVEANVEAVDLRVYYLCRRKTYNVAVRIGYCGFSADRGTLEFDCGEDVCNRLSVKVCIFFNCLVNKFFHRGRAAYNNFVACGQSRLSGERSYGNCGFALVCAFLSVG